MPFHTSLSVRHVNGKKWELTEPLVWEGQRELFVIRSGFQTDFASIPKPLRWLLDNAGDNSEAAVLHDAVWRESKRTSGARVDPADADGMFRRALAETGSTALTRGLMWFGVRAAAIVKGRYGRKGPRREVKLAQLVAVFLLGLVTAAIPTLVAGLGLFVFWVWNWIAAILWRGYERRRLSDLGGNWPWPHHRRYERTEPPKKERLVILGVSTPEAVTIREAVVDCSIDDVLVGAIVGEPAGPVVVAHEATRAAS